MYIVMAICASSYLVLSCNRSDGVHPCNNEKEIAIGVVRIIRNIIFKQFIFIMQSFCVEDNISHCDVLSMHTYKRMKCRPLLRVEEINDKSYMRD